MGGFNGKTPFSKSVESSNGKTLFSKSVELNNGKTLLLKSEELKTAFQRAVTRQSGDNVLPITTLE